MRRKREENKRWKEEILDNREGVKGREEKGKMIERR